ncbi:signal peptidase I [Kitasatospora camelliae]|uniref:signal peptidase I n=1 Tax=Kitasatospora camelliae TaxID=3156397 RepID=UPI003B58A4A6
MVIGARSGTPEPEGTGAAPEEKDEGVDSAGTEPTEPTGSTESTERGGDGTDRTQDNPKAAKQRSFWKELPILIGIALILALVIKTFFVQAFSIPSGSMENTLRVGDRVLVDKLTPWFGSEPERGEVVVFRDPGGWLDGEPTQRSDSAFVRGVQDVFSFIGLMPSSDEKDLIKRVIAVGGDTVECQGSGPVKVNGVALDEPYIYPGDTPCGQKPFGPVKVPEGRIWVMGDHRGNSLDSRYHQDQPGGGTVPAGNVVGRAFVVAWPIGDWATLPVPDTFDQKGLSSAASLVPTAPALAGAAGALPVVWLLRRRRD